MNRFSPKQTKKSNKVGKILSDNQTSMRIHRLTNKPTINNFKGMSENLEWFEPIVIPGYPTIG